jgi:peroxiredoxin/mono/diheme cytochrome c family protein
MRRALLLLAALAPLAGAPGAAPPANEQPVADFRLGDFRGKPHALADYADRKAVVVAFLGAGCPLSQRYAARLGEMAREYGPRGVTFLGLDSNRQDSPDDLARLARDHRIDFPLLKDPGSAVADRLGARRNPEVFVLDGRRVVRYRGRVDDEYGVGFSRPAPRERDLAAALDELLAGKAVSRPVTEAAGCPIGRVERRTPRGDVTYARQVSRLLQRHCAACHHAGGVAPFALTTYADSAGWAEAAREAVRDGRMPPWDADPKYGTFAGDPSLTAEEKRLLEEWVDNGASEGDPKELPAPVTFADGWRIPKPDLVVKLPEPVKVPARGTLPYTYVTVDPGFREDRWVQASEVRPGVPAVVHHVVVMVQEPGAPPVAAQAGLGDPVAVGAPGTGPLVFPEGVARLVPAGSKLVFQLHYTPNGTERADQTSVGLVFADPAKVRKVMRADMAINHRLRIPPRAADHMEAASYTFRQDAVLYALYPHMHLRGKAFWVQAAYPDGRVEVLLDVPRYRFDWQTRYALAEPKRMPEGTKLHCLARYDNSAANPANPDPAAEVRFGEQTWDEMLVLYFDLALAEQDLREPRPAVKALGGGRYEAVFRYRPPVGTKAIYLAGSFNGWKPTGLKMDGPDADGRYTARVELPAGRHEYKYVLDGKGWRQDPSNPLQAGAFNNSVLAVPGPAGEKRV